MNEQKTDTIQCSICHKTFHNQEELQKHNREFHPQGQMKDQGSMKEHSHQSHMGSGHSPNDSQQEQRKAPGSEQRHPEEGQQPKQKRAAS